MSHHSCAEIRGLYLDVANWGVKRCEAIEPPVLDQRCEGFNFDSNKLCTLLDTVLSSSEFRGVTSGLKATN